MAASLGRLCVRGAVWSRTPAVSQPPGVRALCRPPEDIDVSRYKDHPWEYLSSDEYVERYGARLVWADYRRNHKGSIPPQKTRKMCIVMEMKTRHQIVSEKLGYTVMLRRGDKVSGNPCPICRDQKIVVDYRNVKLLQQFMCPHTGVVYDPTRTGVCMKQHKRLVKAITEAEDQGFLPVLIPHKDITFGEYSRNHGAVAQTPPAPAGPWYSWYEWQEPPEEEVMKLQKLYKPYLKEMMGEQ